MAKYFKYIKLGCLALPFLLGFNSVANAVKFEVKGNIIKGSCKVVSPTLDVTFNLPIQTNTIKEAVTDKTHVKQFLFGYECDSFDFSNGNAGVPYLMKITSGSGTEVNSMNKIYPTNNITNSAFVLWSCKDDESSCKIVELSKSEHVPFTIKGNGKAENLFEVSVVKLDGESSLKPGELLSSIDITLEQP